MKPVYAVIDTETTGFGSDDEICELAVIVLSHEFKLIDFMDTIVRTQVSNSAEMVNGISTDLMLRSPGMQETSALLLNLLSRHAVTTLVGHNISFDLRFLVRAIPQLGAYQNQTLCTLRMAAECRILGAKLSSLAIRLGVPVVGQVHSAFTDAALCAGVLRAMMRTRIPPWHSPLGWNHAAETAGPFSRTTEEYKKTILSRLEFC